MGPGSGSQIRPFVLACLEGPLGQRQNVIELLRRQSALLGAPVCTMEPEFRQARSLLSFLPSRRRARRGFSSTRRCSAAVSFARLTSQLFSPPFRPIAAMTERVRASTVGLDSGWSFSDFLHNFFELAQHPAMASEVSWCRAAAPRAGERGVVRGPAGTGTTVARRGADPGRDGHGPARRWRDRKIDDRAAARHRHGGRQPLVRADEHAHARHLGTGRRQRSYEGRSDLGTAQPEIRGRDVGLCPGDLRTVGAAARGCAESGAGSVPASTPATRSRRPPRPAGRLPLPRPSTGCAPPGGTCRQARTGGRLSPGIRYGFAASPATSSRGTSVPKSIAARQLWDRDTGKPATKERTGFILDRAYRDITIVDSGSAARSQWNSSAISLITAGTASPT